MPIPKPTESESKDDFIARFVADEDQRLAIAFYEWANRNKKAKVGEIVENIKLEKKITCNIKQIGSDDDRILRFVVTDETQDSDDDILLFEGWNLSRFVKNPVGLYMHQYDKPAMAKAVNVIKDELNKTISIDYKFPSFDEMSSDKNFVSDWAKLTDTVYNLYKNGYMNAVSVGFDSKDSTKNPNSQYGRIYKDKNLLEVSFVSVPANPNALLTAKSKGFIDDEGIKALKQFEENQVEEKSEKGEDEMEEDKKTIKAGNTLNVKNRENLLNIINMMNSAMMIANQMMNNYQELSQDDPEEVPDEMPMIENIKEVEDEEIIEKSKEVEEKIVEKIKTIEKFIVDGFEITE